MVRQEAKLDIPHVHGLRQVEGLLGAGIVGLEVAEQSPVLARVRLRAQQLKSPDCRRVELEVGEQYRVEVDLLRQCERDPLLLLVALGHGVRVLVLIQHVVRPLHAVGRGHQLGAHVARHVVEPVLERHGRPRVHSSPTAHNRAGFHGRAGGGGGHTSAVDARRADGGRLLVHSRHELAQRQDLVVAGVVGFGGWGSWGGRRRRRPREQERR
mmetsp:Transcript_14/g.34  ORF Transcript_14/g.34 Transcript_14/m.34 type:complete len:212 (+) Transcript_14:359-994(+)